MKSAYFVMGPESSGNRMMAFAVTSTGFLSDGGGVSGSLDKYIITTEWFKGGVNTSDIIRSIESAPNRIVFSRSIPRRGYPNKEWANIKSICNKLLEFDYNVYPLVMYRDKDIIIKSQVRRKHVPTEEIASKFIDKAYNHIDSNLFKVKLQTIRIVYESFVTDETYRINTFKSIGLPPPNMEFFNANDKY